MSYKILTSKTIAPKIKLLEIEAPLIAKKRKPGQFVIVHLHEYSERIPLTVVDSDLERGSITLIVQEAGKSTHELNSLPVGGEIMDISGPLGIASEVEKFGTVAVIGGGVGTGVAYPNAVALKQAGNQVISIIGARSKKYVILEEALRKVSDACYVTTDDGSYGEHLLAPQKLQQLIEAGIHFDYVLSIGPLPMMRAVTQVTRPFGIKTVVSLNTIMIDGTGMCGGCRAVVGGKTLFTCVDGPEFDGHQVDFDSLMKRSRSYLHEEEEARCRLEVVHQVPPKEKMLIPRQKMPVQDPLERAHNFEEVNLGYTEEQAMLEAQRCLQCANPKCVAGCPVAVKIPQFIDKIVAGDFLEAGRILREDNLIAEVCGRVCPQSEQCEGQCILGRKGDAVNIGALERFAATYLSENDYEDTAELPARSGHKVAIVGSGPAGLSCAGDLVRQGHEVTVFEALHDFGGVLIYGIPEFRLPKRIVRREVEKLKKLGVQFQKNVLVGASLSVDELLREEGYDAVFIAAGAGLPRFLNVPGEHMIGVYSANEFLTRVNLMKAYHPRYDTPIYDCKDKVVAVVGGGNTAMDSVRVALRLGAREAHIIYRRTAEEMPARKEEIEHAQEEGIQFNFLCNPVEFVGDEKGWLTGVRLQKMALGEPDATGRRKPVVIPGAETLMPVDMVVIAVGNGSNPILQKTSPDLTFNKYGNVVVDLESMATSKKGVYAGGDIVTGGATVILAMGAGRKAAKAIQGYLEALPAAAQRWNRSLEPWE
jgi:glutamate synthase (NADPH/NADH) small chain